MTLDDSYDQMRAGTATAPLRDEIARLEDENKGLRWLVSHYEAALTIIKRKDIIEGVRSDFLK